VEVNEMVRIKPCIFEWWKSAAPIVWATVAYVLPMVIADLSDLKPSLMWTRWLMTGLIFALKILLDKLTHVGDAPCETTE